MKLAKVGLLLDKNWKRKSIWYWDKNYEEQKFIGLA